MVASQYLWEKLTYENILNSVEKVLGLKLSNLCLRRNSYINRVFELERADNKERFIVKFYRPGRWATDMILEEHAFIKELFQNDIPVIPPLDFSGQTLFFLENIPFAVYPKKGGRALDEFDKPGWQQIGRLLARLHLIGAKHPQAKRLTWKPALATQKHLDTLILGKYLVDDFERSLQRTADSFIKKAEPLFDKAESILLHGDCHKGNLIHRPGEGVYIVDFDDICLGPPVQDLWMLLPGHAAEAEQEIEWFLEGYETFRPFERSSLELIPALRGMRIIHFAAWCAVQSQEPDFAEHFPEWGSPKYWNGLIKELQEITNEL